MARVDGHRRGSPKKKLPAGREYLMLCRGRPQQDGFKHKSCRIDALFRITYAGLLANSRLHFVFEDCTILQCTPALLRHWKPRGGPQEVASESRLLEIFEDVLKRSPREGVEIQVGKRLVLCIEEVLTDGPVGGRSNRFDTVFMLRESGCELRFDQSKSVSPALSNFPETAAPVPASGSKKGGRGQGSRILVVLGGVRDLTKHEEVAVHEACQRLHIPERWVKIGRVPELTSKCIKILEGAAKINFLQPAIERCAKLEWRTPDPADGDVDSDFPRLPLHFVYEIRPQTPLVDFMYSPEAAMLAVDVFRGSHHSNDHFALSIIDSSGQAVTLRNSDMQNILRQNEAQDRLTRLARRGARRTTISGLLEAEFDWWRSEGFVDRLYVLYADEHAPAAPRATTQAYDPSSFVSVVFLTAGTSAGTDCSVATVALRASLGPESSAPALAAMLHNEGFLCPIIGPAFSDSGCNSINQPTKSPGMVLPESSVPNGTVLPESSVPNGFMPISASRAEIPIFSSGYPDMSEQSQGEPARFNPSVAENASSRNAFVARDSEVQLCTKPPPPPPRWVNNNASSAGRPVPPPPPVPAGGLPAYKYKWKQQESVKEPQSCTAMVAHG